MRIETKDTERQKKEIYKYLLRIFFRLRPSRIFL